MTLRQHCDHRQIVILITAVDITKDSIIGEKHHQITLLQHRQLVHLRPRCDAKHEALASYEARKEDLRYFASVGKQMLLQIEKEVMYVLNVFISLNSVHSFKSPNRALEE